MNIKLHRILILFFIIVLIKSCAYFEKDKFVYGFIESIYQLDSNCLNSVRQILAPIYLENNNCEISKVYILNIKHDTTWPFPQRLEDSNNIFLGLIFEPDSLDVRIVNISPESSEIHQCDIIENGTRLIIMNGRMYRTNLHLLEEQSCIRFDTTYQFQSYMDREMEILELTEVTALYGDWKSDINDASRFKKDIYNNTWHFTKQKDFLLISGSDTLLTTKFEMYSDTLFIRPNIDTFRIWTCTDDLLVISKFGSKDSHILERP